MECGVLFSMARGVCFFNYCCFLNRDKRPHPLIHPKTFLSVHRGKTKLYRKKQQKHLHWTIHPSTKTCTKGPVFQEERRSSWVCIPWLRPGFRLLKPNSPVLAGTRPWELLAEEQSALLSSPSHQPVSIFVHSLTLT